MSKRLRLTMIVPCLAFASLETTAKAEGNSAITDRLLEAHRVAVSATVTVSGELNPVREVFVVEKKDYIGWIAVELFERTRRGGAEAGVASIDFKRTQPISSLDYVHVRLALGGASAGETIDYTIVRRSLVVTKVGDALYVAEVGDAARLVDKLRSADLEISHEESEAARRFIAQSDSR